MYFLFSFVYLNDGLGLNETSHATLVTEFLPDPPKPKNTPPNNNQNVVYSYYRPDRTGAVLQDMLAAHAFAYKHNLTYGGQCQPNARQRKRYQHEPSYINSHVHMVQSIGLDHLLKFNQSCQGAKTLYMKIIMDEATPEWLHYIKSILKYPPKPPNFSIVVHIRRGDVNPCPGTRPRWRYLPNAYFLRVLDHLTAIHPHADVKLFSESLSFESFQEFHKRGYKVQLDGDLFEVWKAILVANVLVTSSSLFSDTPALFLHQQNATILKPRSEDFPVRTNHTSHQLQARMAQLCPLRPWNERLRRHDERHNRTKNDEDDDDDSEDDDSSGDDDDDS